jgi:carnosine synthase
MTAAERQRVRAATPMSPSMALLQELGPLDRVGARTADGRRLRRHALKGAVVAFVTAGYSGKRFIFEKAKELGVRTIILDAADSWAQLLVEEGVAEKFVPIDFAESDTVFEQCLKGLKKAAAEMGSGSGGGSSGGGGGSGSIDGVTTFCELAVPLVARLAEALGLPGNSPDAVDAARDKYETRAAMAKAGLPTPRNARISKPEDVDPAGQHVGFPAVIKPVSGAASIGVVRVNDAQALREAYERVARDMSRARVVAGALVEGHDDDDEEEGARPAAAAGNNASATSQGEGGAAGSAGAGGPDGSAPSITKKAKGAASSWINVELMLEEYLDGPEVDCDLILSQGSCVYGAVTDNWPTVEPYFNETGSNCPSILSRSTQKELLELSVASVRALGLKEGVFHVEAKATSRGARLIEVNCRMGGGPVRDTNLLVWGVDLVEEHLMTAAGIPSRPPIARKPLVNMAEYSINADKSGVLERDDFLAEWASHPDVLYARPLAKAGERVVCVADGLPTWICELMVVKPRVEEAIEFVKGIEKAISPLPIKAVAAGK